MKILNNTPFTVAPIPGRIPFPDHSVSFVIKGSFHLARDIAAKALPEQLSPSGDQFYPGDEDGQGSLYYGSDFVYFKPGADLMIVGHCHAPDGTSVTICPVEFKVGNFQKSLTIIGERLWNSEDSLRPFTDPEPFTSLALRYENSFGGGEVKNNPAGKGIYPTREWAGQPLPNIERKGKPVTNRKSRPEPEGFGPINALWPQRAEWLGTYDEEWKKNRWPWFPEDFDWRYGNQAPADQQLKGYLKGDEPLCFDHMHPKYPKFQSQLPGVRVKCFIQKSAGMESDTPVFKEIPMNLDTLWADMDTRTLVLSWRGWTKTISREYEDIEYLYILSEPIDEADHPLEHYHEKFRAALRADEIKWGMAPEVPMKPDEPDPPSEQEKAPTVALPEEPEEKEQTEPREPEEPFDLKKRLQAQSAAFMGHLGIELSAEHEALLNRLTETDPAEIDAARLEELEQEKAKALAELGLDPDDLPVPSEKARNEQARIMKALGMDEAHIAAMTRYPAMNEFWGVMAAVLPKMGIDPENLDHMIAKAKKLNMVPPKKEADSAELLEMRPQAEEPDKAPDLALTRERVEEMARDKTSFEQADFKGLNLSGLDLSGLDFSHADFCGTCLADANLSRAKMDHADFTKADLSRADLTGADLSFAVFNEAGLASTIAAKAILHNAVLDSADLAQCSFSQADLTGASLKQSVLNNADGSGAVMENCDLTGAILDDAIFEGAGMSRANLTDCRARGAWFSNADMRSALFHRCDLCNAEFSKAVLNNADFKEANLTETNIERVVCAHADFNRADLTELRASGSNFTGSCFSQVSARESIWVDAKLNLTDFTFSDLDGANFRGARMAGADLTASSMKFARLIKTDLNHAKLIRANLFQGSFEQADLDGTDLRGANLYGAQFFEAKLRNTLVARANLTMTKLDKKTKG